MTQTRPGSHRNGSHGKGPAFTRRETLAAGLALATPAPLLAAPAHTPAAADRLWYRQPAGVWTEALPVGNGRLGAMVFGRVAQERLQLNEDTLWAGAPYQPANPQAREALPQVRALLAQGRYSEATALASEAMMAKPLTQMPYGSLGDLLIDFTDARQPDHYRRELDLANGIATTVHGDGALGLRREVFASAVDQVVVMRIEAQGEGARFGFDLAHRGPRAITLRPDQYGEGSAPIRVAETDWLAREPLHPAEFPPAPVECRADGPGALLVTGRNEAAGGIPAGLGWALRVRVIGDGTISAAARGITVRGAQAVTVIVSAATGFVDFSRTDADPVARVRKVGQAAERKSYRALRQAHVADHRALYGGFALDLGTTPAAAMPTDARIAAAGSGNDPALVALYLHYARYLLMGCSRPGTQPANLQGLWNESTSPPWGSKYTININTEMNYWPADPAGLGLCVEPLVRMTEELAVTGAHTARTMYGAGGWVAHHNTDLWRASAPIDGPLWGLWPCGGAWLCNTLYAHWDHRRDDALLARIYPLLAGAARFFMDTLVEDPGGRGLVTSPSLSPENAHPFGSSLCAGPAMDRQIVRELFANTVHGGTLLGRDVEWLGQVAATAKRIAPDRIGAQGQLQEWLEDWDAQAPDQHHRHVSHLYAVYPGSAINPRDTPALAEAAKVSLRQRGDRSTGWATAWRVCLWARLGEGDHSHAVLMGLLGPERTYPNMFDAHPPFQIDGNFGGAAGIMEMLLQSWGGELHVLPALPSAWPDGAITGLRARGGLRVDLEWRAGRPIALTVRGKPGAPLAIRTGAERLSATIPPAGTYVHRWA